MYAAHRLLPIRYPKAAAATPRNPSATIAIAMPATPTAGFATHPVTSVDSVAVCARSNGGRTDSPGWPSRRPGDRGEAMATWIPGVDSEPCFLHSSLFTTLHVPPGGCVRGGGGLGLTTGRGGPL